MSLDISPIPDNKKLPEKLSKRFTARNDGFVCVNCGTTVEPSKKSYRNHCNVCLTSLHVDIFPGDRAAECGGIMSPIGIEQKNGEWTIIHRCQKCGKTQKNITTSDDSFDKIIEISKSVKGR